MGPPRKGASPNPGRHTLNPQSIYPAASTLFGNNTRIHDELSLSHGPDSKRLAQGAEMEIDDNEPVARPNAWVPGMATLQRVTANQGVSELSASSLLRGGTLGRGLGSLESGLAHRLLPPLEKPQSPGWGGVRADQGLANLDSLRRKSGNKLDSLQGPGKKLKVADSLFQGGESRGKLGGEQPGKQSGRGLVTPLPGVKSKTTSQLPLTTVTKAAMIEEELTNVATGDDVIGFYARHGQDTEARFFYCNRAPETVFNFRPYDLVVVPREDVAPEYFTMSATGVVKIGPGANTKTEFTALGDWVREKTVFGILRKMSFFRYYLIYKAFNFWRHAVRRKLYSKVRATLNSKLFLAKPTFVGALLEVRAYVHELSQIAMVALSPGHLYTLDEFSDAQLQQRVQKATPALEACVEKVQQCLERVCKDVTKQVQLFQDSIKDEGELDDLSGVNLYPSRGSEKVRSMVSIKQEKIERAKTYRRVIEEAKQLGDFIRLADYMLVEGLVDRTISTTEELLALLELPRTGSDKTSKGVFLTTVSFSETSLEFTPSEGEILQVVDSTVLEGVISLVQAAPRLLFMRSFGQHFEEKLTGLNPVAIIRETDRFLELRTKIDGVIRQDFAEANQYVQIFEEHRQIYTWESTWSPDAYGAERHSSKQFREDLARQREWRAELDRMKVGNSIGVLHIDSKSLRNSLLPVTARTLDAVKVVLLAAAREETVTVLMSFQQRIRALQDRPDQLDNFVDFMKLLEEMGEARKAAMAEAAVVDDLYTLLSAYEMKVPTGDSVKLDDLHEAVTAYQDGLSAAETFIEERKNGMMADLEQQIGLLSDEALTLLGTLHGARFVDPEGDATEIVTELEASRAALAAARAKAETFQGYQKLFLMTVDDFGNLKETEKECNGRYAVWKSLYDWECKTQQWRGGPIQALHVAEISAAVEENNKEAFKMGKANKEDRVVYRLKDSIDEFKKIMPLIEELANEALKPRHWEAIFTAIGARISADAPFSIDDLLAHDILAKMDDVSRVSTNASKEHSLEKSLTKMVTDWDGLEFRTVAYKDTGTFIVGGVDEIQAILDDQIVKIQSMRASPFIRPFEARASDWQDTLSTLQDLLDNWRTCQGTWQYLEPIFGSEDIMKQMPEEGEKFKTVDQMWRDMMKRTVAAPGCLGIARDKERLARLEEANKLLDAIQKGLASYLEVKRVAFPRFFFLSNDEMLEILSETKDPLRVQPHLKKCFEGISTLEFQDNMEITGMCSAESEVVALAEKINPVAANGAVEKWLLQVENQMVDSVRDHCRRSVLAYAETARERWVLDWPGQVVLVVSAIYWTKHCTDAIAAGPAAVGEYEKTCTQQLSQIVSLVRGNLTKLNRATLSALVVMDVHARDTVAMMAREGVDSASNFTWQSQLRYYWEDDTCQVRMMNASVEYGYEYLGNSSRLVITPLTDRCYRTLMGAIHLNLGGAPEGPAGTGKTETTKDLAKALARQCVVFNCSDSLDYLAMAKFFKGLAASGAWACFDEFNRIDLEVLSVVAQQVLEIQLAVQNKVKTFVFEGSELILKPTCNVFITMNPGYAGRSELPDNLKALFRTVAMMVPDYGMISEIMLFSNGYLKARDCARKIVATYRLCSEQLSSQDHYDYGMRAVMAVLRAASNLKRRFPDEDEFVLMLRSIIDVNLCKFLSHDVPLFNGIVSDLFPGVVLPKPDYTALDYAMRENCARLGLQPKDYFLTKVVQLYEMIIVRHGLMLVGQPFSGKTSAIRVLAGALSDMAAAGQAETKVQVATINPKAVTMGQLYGQTDPVTQEWTDGILAVKFRQQSAEQSSDRKWLVLDGPVDAIWIENMNTVLDDNKKLCLPNSEIIQMSSSMNMIFEVGDLAVASPATVSRCGMVYLEPHQLGWQPLVASWLPTLPNPLLNPETRAHLQGLFDWLVPPCLRFLRKSVREISPTSDANVVRALMRTFDALVRELRDEGTAKTLNPEKLAQWVDGLFLFSLTWSVACTGNNEGRVGFDKFIRELVGGGVPVGYESYVPPVHVPFRCPLIPAEHGELIFDYVFEKETCKWKLWTATIEKTEIPDNAQFSEIIIPTADSARYTFLLDTAIQAGYPILLVGPTGTGKSVYVNRHLMSGLAKDRYTTMNVCFSARTTANMVQAQIDGRLDKRKKGVYGPPFGKRCAIFVDDLNMPQLEVYGAQPPIELLRQFMDHDGWYGRDNVFRDMVDVQFVAAMGPAGGGRNAVTARYLRHFNTVGMAQLADSSLSAIFSSILTWHLTSAPFPTDVRKLCPSVIAATMDVYNAAMASLLPTPTKSHYTFNLRDFARVIQGIMLQPAASLPAAGPPAAKSHVRLWAHEVLRVFYDRLVDDVDRTWLLTHMKEMVKKHFGFGFEDLFGHLRQGEGGEIGAQEMRRCFFGDYADSTAEPEARQYSEVSDVPKLLTTMEEYLMDFNGTSKRPMNLAIFLFAVEHISRICRLLKQPGGHMLLVGVGGSGRQSLTRLAAHIAGMEVHQVEISKSYTRVEWREDLKKMLRRAGAEGHPGVFLFSDTQIKDESFVEDINNILNSGEVPNMFPNDEKAQVLESVRPIAAALGKTLETPTELWAFFTAQCQQKLHIMLCMSPVGDAFRDRLRQYPSLVNCCTIDWFQAWPEDALEAVAHKFLGETAGLDQKMRPAIVRICKAFHESVRIYSEKFKQDLGRHNYLTPTSYLELLATFQSLLQAKQAEKLKLKGRYEVGLEKLSSSAVQVAQMQGELTDLKPKLIQTVAEVEELMARVEKEKREVVEPTKAIVQRDEEDASAQAADAKAIKDECEGALALAMPILEEALAALDTLSPNDINYVKKLSNPPGAVKLVMEAVCVILDVKPVKIPDGKGGSVLDYWKPSVALLNDKDFLGNLKTYDKDNINPKIIARIRKEYTSNPEFTPERAANASAAAEGLCKWVTAMDKYDAVAKVVAPKKAALLIAEDKYETVMVGLRAKQAELKAILDKLAGMEAELEVNMRKKEQLQHEVEQCTVKLERAEQLIGGLGGEKTRWTAAAQELGAQYDNLTGDMLVAAGVVSYLGAFTAGDSQYGNLTGDMLVAAGVVSYLGAFTAGYRQEIVEKWVALCASEQIPRSPTFSLTSVLGDAVKTREWLIAGLPNDSFSIENGIVVANARKWPLMIDPQGQANKWVKNMEKNNNLQVIKLTEGGEYMRTLENAIQFGLPVLLENVGEELDPSLEPLLLKQVFKVGGVPCIRLGDSTIEYSSDFRFYITTKLRNPHYLPETAVKVTLLNFMITKEGLSDQLLGVVVAKERPDLEAQKNELVLQGAENKRKLKELEDQILEVLSSSEGNILEDETAIRVISEAKAVGNDIAEKQVLAEQTEKNIDSARRAYKPCGDYGATLFFCITDLANIEPMYQYSLPWFVNLFVGSIAASARADDVGARLESIHAHFTYALYCNVCRSLFEKDKLLFAFLLTSRIMGARGEVDGAELMFLMTGTCGVAAAAAATPAAGANPAPAWLQEKAWGELCTLARLPAFADVPASVKESPDGWRAIYDSPEPHTVTPPGSLSGLPLFHRLLLTRCLRPDKVVPAVQDFVASIMGRRFVEPPLFDLAACYADSSATCPLIFVLSAGSDPTAALLKFAADKEMADKIYPISLGQGQGPKAAAMIADAAAVGAWVLLQNCHLAPSWMPALEKICEDISTKGEVNPAFRLWMTSYPSPKFPVSILQNGVKMTNEPPKGLKANIRRSYGLDPIANEEFFGGSKRPGPFHRLLFGLAFFHGVIQERRRFGPLGWNIPYGFDDGDLRICVRQLRMLLDEAPSDDSLPLEALNYVTGECNYGGRVTDDKDRILLTTILRNVYCPEMLRTNYKLSESGLYFAPEADTLSGVLEYVETLPIVPQPEAFGLHPNADIAKDMNDTSLMLNSLLVIDSGGGGGGKKGGGTEVDAVGAVVRDILARLPPNFDIEACQQKYPVLYEESMNTTLAQEMTRFNKLSEKIRTSLTEMLKAIQGLVVMSSDLETAYRSIAVNQVPAMWARVSYPSLKPLNGYVKDLLERLTMLQTWFETGKPAVYWISGFFFAQSFMTAALQNYARAQKVAVDEVGFDFEFLGMDPGEYTEGPSEGVYIRGLYLEGCAWDPVKKQLCESAPKVLHSFAPVIWLKPTPVSKMSQYPHYDCPIYRTAERRGVLATTGHSTNFVMKIRMPTDKKASHWTMRGVAMLCALSD